LYAHLTALASTIFLTTKQICRVLRILCTRPRRARHGRARTWSSPSRHPLFVYLGTADHACCAPWEALRAGKKIHHWDDCETNVVGNVYASSFSLATSKLSHLKCRSPWMSQERDGRGATPYVTCRFALRLSRLSLTYLWVAWVYVLSLFACVQAAVLGLQTSFGPAFFLPQRVRHPMQPYPRSINRMHSLRSSRIRKGMTTTRRYRTRKVVRWAIARSAWMQ
jgi:hypothetical protein